MAPLLAIEEARDRVLAAVGPLEPERAGLEDALDRVLAEDVTSEIDSPPFDASAMDGFAVAAGAAGRRALVGESRAGRPAAVAVDPGTAIRISTGAAIPEGATAVVPVEHAEATTDSVLVPKTRAGANIRRAGEDLRRGDVVLRAGTDLGPAELALLASVGRHEPLCGRRPRVALLVTGDELVQAGGELGPGMLFSSNGYGLAAQVRRAGAEPLTVRHVPDSAEATRAALAEALEDADAVCVSGGVSVGAHDHVKGALADLGAVERFWGVRLKPGKPTWFGTRGSTPVFGLPGNPVSAMVTFHLFARPALRRLAGAEPLPEAASALLEEPVALNPRRAQALRCRLSSRDGSWQASLTGEQGSHQLTSMIGADALAFVPQGDGELSAGTEVQVERL